MTNLRKQLLRYSDKYCVSYKIISLIPLEIDKKIVQKKSKANFPMKKRLRPHFSHSTE